jgi:predicted alpha/beta superfamily hydrolase
MTHRYPSRVTLLLCLALATLAGCPEPAPTPLHDVTFEVTVPPETPVNATLSLVGSYPSLGNGAAPGLELVYQGDALFVVKTQLPADRDITYSVVVTQPSEQVQLDAAGAPVPAHTLRVDPANPVVRLSVERFGPASGSTQPQTVFLVTVPGNTPPNDPVWLSGNHALLGNWNGAGVRLHKAMGDRYATTLSFAPELSLQFKATRGSWETVEKGSKGEEIGNHTHKTGSGFERVSLTVASWADIGGVEEPPPVLTGIIERIQAVPSVHVKARDLIIWLPPDYKDANNTKTYPVLYMHDGQNLMDASTGFNGEWGVDEIAQEMVLSGQVEPLIIVGIYNSGSERSLDYTQVPEPSRPDAPGGNADKYGRFLVEELKPLIDGRYRTKPEPQYTGLAGSSLGGLVSMYLGMTKADTFTRLGVISPSVWWANRDIVTRVNNLPGKLPQTRIWLDIGTEESLNSEETVADTRALRDALVAKGWVLDADLKYLEVQGGQHTEVAWNARFDDILKYLYPKQ